MQMRENEEIIIIYQEELWKVRYFKSLQWERIVDEWQERKLWEVRVRKRELQCIGDVVKFSVVWNKEMETL